MSAPFSATRFRLITCLFIFSLLSLSGCGGGGGGATSAGPTTNPTSPVNPPTNPTRPVNPPTNPTVCTSTSEGCLTATAYRTRINTLLQTIRGHPGFSNSWGLTAIKADAAWAKLELARGTGTRPGAGHTVGAIDSGIDASHPVFSGKTVTEYFLAGATDEGGSLPSHGTGVAGMMVAAPNLLYTSTPLNAARGVAWGADIAMFAIPVGLGPTDYRPITLATLNSIDTIWETNLNDVITWPQGGRSLDFVNVSVGRSGIINMYSRTDLSANFGKTVTALAQSGQSEKTVFVWAAGNAHGKTCDPSNALFTAHPNLCVARQDPQGTVVYEVNAASPEIMAGLPARFSELRENLIAVVAVGTNREIADFSNRCGLAADWCIAAPGDDLHGVAYFGPIQGQNAQRGTARHVSGTSYAAPMVTGGLVVMKHFFRSQLSNTALVRRLYATADKSGIYANRAVYGQGLMDLDKAVSPIGFTYVASGNQVDDGGTALDGTSLILGASFGDGFTRSFADQEIAAFDESGAPFWYSLEGFASTQPRSSIQSRLTKFMHSTANSRGFGMFRPVLGALQTDSSALNSGRLSLGLMDTPIIVDDGGHLSLMGQAVAVNTPPISDQFGFSLFSTEGSGSQARRVTGMEFTSRSRKFPMVFRSGVVAERESLLASSAAGAFGRVSGTSVFAGVEGGFQVDSWRLSAGAEVGSVAANVRQSLIAVNSPLVTSAFALRAGRKLNERDTVKFALSQPVRIESGRAEYTIPVGRTIEGEVLKSFNSVDLEPTGRQIDLSAQWRRALPASSGDFRLAASLSLQPGHRATAEPELSVMAGWRLGF